MMRARVRGVALVVALTIGVGAAQFGCTASAPALPPLSDAEILQRLGERAAAVRTVRAVMDLRFTDPQGESIRLDGAVVVAFPDRLRVQAWKLGNTVVDVTVRGGEVWVATGGGSASSGGAERLAALADRRLVEALAHFGGDVWDRARVVGGEGEGEGAGPAAELTAVIGLDSASGVICFIDRRAATLTRLSQASATTGESRDLRLSGYRTIDGVEWPTRLEFAGPEGVVRVDLSEIELNTPIAEHVFDPPPRASKRP